MVLRGSCNSGVTTSNEKGLLSGIVDMRINKKGIVNLLLIPQLEEDRFGVTYDTQGEWILNTSKGKKIMCKRDIGVCN